MDCLKSAFKLWNYFRLTSWADTHVVVFPTYVIFGIDITIQFKLNVNKNCYTIPTFWYKIINFACENCIVFNINDK